MYIKKKTVNPVFIPLLLCSAKCLFAVIRLITSLCPLCNCPRMPLHLNLALPPSTLLCSRCRCQRIGYQRQVTWAGTGNPPEWFTKCNLREFCCTILVAWDQFHSSVSVLSSFRVKWKKENVSCGIMSQTLQRTNRFCDSLIPARWDMTAIVSSS